MRIWITGIAGFLGSHLADALIAEGHQVRGNDNLLCGEIGNVPCFENDQFIYSGDAIDCRDFDTMKTQFDIFKPDVVVHCAATAHEGLSSFSPSFITRNIYEASVSTFSASIASGCKRIIYLSSMARYGNQTPPFIESMQPRPVDPYGVAKVAAEDTLKILCETHDVKWSIAVPHNIIGTRQRYVDPYRNVASIMINRTKQNKPIIIYGDGGQMRCFSPVKDCIPSLIKMVKGQADGEIVNIGPDRDEITINKLAEIILELNNSIMLPKYMPGRPNEVYLAFTSSEKAMRLLDFKPQQDLRSCLKEMFDYIEPAPFIYDFPLEIITDKMPATWRERLM